MTTSENKQPTKLKVLRWITLIVTFVAGLLLLVGNYYWLFFITDSFDNDFGSDYSGFYFLGLVIFFIYFLILGLQFFAVAGITWFRPAIGTVISLGLTPLHYIFLNWVAPTSPLLIIVPLLFLCMGLLNFTIWWFLRQNRLNQLQYSPGL